MSNLQSASKASPKVKENEILIAKQADGNWKGFMHKNGNPIEVRDGDPYTCLTLLLTMG